MRRLFILALLSCIVFSVKSQEFLSLDSCRALAIANNKDLMISNERINSAHYERKAAFTNYLPSLSATGAYMRNQKEFSLLNNDQKGALNHVGTTVNGSIQEFAQAIGTQFPDLQPLVSSLGNTVVDPLNGIGNSVVDAFRTDTRNVYAGALTLTQPLYMGGKIRAYNKITKYTEELAHQQHQTGLQEVILSTDQAYWQVVSLANKKKLAESYLKLLRKMDSDMEKMINEGVATKADGLSVRVKVNEAEMTLTKVEDGLSLSKMLLCQLCGLDLTTPITLLDESIEDIPVMKNNTAFDMDAVYSTRPEIRSLELGTQIYKQKVNVTRAEHLPTVALMGNYIVSNPSVFNGFENKFRGMWNVGVAVQIPIWNWGEGMYKVKAAKAEARIAEYQLNDAKEKIELQVNQSVFKVNEATKKLNMAQKNMEKANENLRYATLGFEEGVIPALNLLEAQTAWVSAQSDKIDAQIDVKLTEIYLQKSLGTLKSSPN
ncbi:TolC family protein [Bacteroides sp. 51]|uniref:TolC family protein n=1 Tax=Bacteroides sp. 51 TaxID=2302938 RepID=UPI0013D65B1B|nr:TolC family protein [Bacteroides sp. 51]NDV83120.1 TolC family protein [Bacteroides sp. 51]